ncbi:MAG TPA: DUF3098 domain-containing protein [Bacteroidetes bacterium]|nr:DUF3098 domain-containing protein [Bacteroidota bacterium]
MAKKDLNKKKQGQKEGFALDKKNYIMIAIGFGIIVLGFLLMIGGKSDDPNVFNPAIFSFRRITLAPVIILFGFAFEIWAIMKKTDQKSEIN